MRCVRYMRPSFCDVMRLLGDGGDRMGHPLRQMYVHLRLTRVFGDDAGTQPPSAGASRRLGECQSHRVEGTQLQVAKASGGHRHGIVYSHVDGGSI